MTLPAKQQLKKVKIRGFKSIQNLEVDFIRINVLIGRNGAGKSNFISAFTLLGEILKKNLILYSTQQGAESLLYNRAECTERISMEFIFSNESSYGFDLVPTDDGCLVFDREYYNCGVVCGLLTEAHAESALQQGPLCNITPEWPSMLQKNNCQVYHFISPKTEVKQACDINNNAFLQNDAGNLAAFLYRLKEQFPNNYRQIVDHIQLIAPYFGDFFLEPQEPNGKQICLRWTEQNQDTVLDAAQFSDGTLRFICLAVLLLQPIELRPAMIIIDEPETGLHPYAVNVFSEMIQQASWDTQVLLSTQSADLLSNFDPEDVLLVNRHGNGTELTRLDEKDLQDWLEDYTLGELWRKNILGEKPVR